MAGKTKAQKEQERLDKKAAELNITVEAVKEQEAKAKADANRIADDKKAADKKEKQDAKLAKENAGYIEEVSTKIKEATTMEELDALSQRVYDLWADKIPAEIEALAATRAEEIEANAPAAQKTVLQSDLQKGWRKVTQEEVSKLDKAVKVKGFDPVTMTADIIE